MISFVMHNLIWTEGLAILGVTIVLGALGFFYFRPLAYCAALAFLFSFYFFRNPERVCPQAVHDPRVIVSPADGKVVAIESGDQDVLEGYAHKVAIFLSAFDVHVNWLPLSGRVEDVVYSPGKFVPAFLPKSSLLNERNDVLVRHERGKTVLVRQIAGTVARKIVCWVMQGQEVLMGQKFGMIKFGSRVELFLPKEAELLVEVGQRVYGGQTVLGRWLWQ